MANHSELPRSEVVARELERLIVGQENIRESIDALTNRVGEQNGRVAKLEHFRAETQGMGRAYLAIFRDLLAIAALLAAVMSAVRA